MTSQRDLLFMFTQQCHQRTGLQWVQVWKSALWLLWRHIFTLFSPRPPQRVSRRYRGGGEIFGDGFPPSCRRDPVSQSGTCPFPAAGSRLTENCFCTCFHINTHNQSRLSSPGSGPLSDRDPGAVQREPWHRRHSKAPWVRGDRHIQHHRGSIQRVPAGTMCLPLSWGNTTLDH